MDLPLGKNVTIEIIASPTNESARKTLTRLCRRDPLIARHHRNQKAKRPSFEKWRRGGKMWHHQMKSKSAAKIERGQSYTVLATFDVVRDLESVERFVKVTPA